MKKVIVIGNGKLATDCLRLLAEHQSATVSLVLYDYSEPSFTNSINSFCEKYSINSAEINKSISLQTIEAIKRLKPDLIFNIFSDIIFPKEILDIPTIGAINFHNGPLPFYRGYGHAVTFWSIFNGETEHGVTWHFMDQGIDTGDIIATRKFHIPHDETALGLNFTCIAEGKKLFEEILTNLLTDNYTRTPQIGPSSRYLSTSIPNDGYLDFSWPYHKIERFLRATDFRPYKNMFSYAKVKHTSRKFIVNTAIPYSLEAHDYQIGEVVGFSNNYLRVATKDSVLDITEAMYKEGFEVSIEDLVNGYNIKKGSLLNDSYSDMMSKAS